MTKPRIRIVNNDGVGRNTRIFANDGTEDEDGNLIETDISGAVQEVDLNLRVGELNTAKISAILIGADIDAEIVELQTRVLPPPPPKTTYRLTIGEVEVTTYDSKCRYTLIRSTPLPEYGSADEEIACGWMGAIGPLELVFEEAT